MEIFLLFIFKMNIFIIFLIKDSLSDRISEFGFRIHGSSGEEDIGDGEDEDEDEDNVLQNG